MVIPIRPSGFDTLGKGYGKVLSRVVLSTSTSLAVCLLFKLSRLHPITSFHVTLRSLSGSFFISQGWRLMVLGPGISAIPFGHALGTTVKLGMAISIFTDALYSVFFCFCNCVIQV